MCLKDALLIVFISMIFMHIVDDYYLQGCLANMKQKSWWKPYIDKDSKYSHDYLMALFMHGYSWSFMIHIPIIITTVAYRLDNNLQFIFASVFINGFVHSIIDHSKCNMLKINLIVDQMLHLMQIGIVLSIFITINN